MAGGEAIDLIVMEDDGQIHIGPGGGNKMGYAFTQEAAVATDDDHLEPVVGQLDAGGGGDGSTV